MSLCLCLATCGTQPLQYPAIYQKKSGMPNMLRFTVYGLQNMPNVESYLLTLVTYTQIHVVGTPITEPLKAQSPQVQIQTQPKCLSKIWQTGSRIPEIPATILLLYC